MSIHWDFAPPFDRGIKGVIFEWVCACGVMRVVRKTELYMLQRAISE